LIIKTNNIKTLKDRGRKVYNCFTSPFEGQKTLWHDICLIQSNVLNILRSVGQIAASYILSDLSCQLRVPGYAFKTQFFRNPQLATRNTQPRIDALFHYSIIPVFRNQIKNKLYINSLPGGKNEKELF